MRAPNVRAAAPARAEVPGTDDCAATRKGSIGRQRICVFAAIFFFVLRDLIEDIAGTQMSDELHLSSITIKLLCMTPLSSVVPGKVTACFLDCQRCAKQCNYVDEGLCAASSRAIFKICSGLCMFTCTSRENISTRKLLSSRSVAPNRETKSSIGS